MKRFLAVLGTVGLSGALVSPALAQSSVTLFGVLDMNARAVKNGDSTWVKSLSNDGYASSRLGFRGVEDLGDGLSAGFWLEGAINGDTGSSRTKFWSRRSTVSLVSQKWGELRFGHDYTPVFRGYATFDPMGVVSIGSITNILGTVGSGAATLVTADNAIMYFLPGNLGGVYGDAMVAANEGVSTVNSTTFPLNSNNKHAAARLGWQNAKVNVAAAYSETTINVGGTGKYKQTFLGGSYQAGPARLIAQVIDGRYGALRQLTWQVGAFIAWDLSQINASYVRGDMKGGTTPGFRSGDDASMVAASYIYNLSKRTNMYATVSFIRNEGGSTKLLPGGATTIAAGGNARAAEFGMRHAF